MKQLYRVPFEQNSERVKRLRHEYVERVLQMDAEEILHEFIYIDEAGFNLTKARRRGRNIIGHRAIINVPGPRGGNITLCAAILQHGVLLRHAKMGPFQHHPQLTVLYLPPYSPFLNPIEKFFSTWQSKVYDLQPQAQVPLIQAMEDACDQVDAAAVQGWIRHSRRFFPRCLANEDIACDVDEILWPDPARRRDNV
ncbi:hypothetical protein PO909_010472 [Leuciscus waleckii]